MVTSPGKPVCSLHRPFRLAARTVRMPLMGTHLPFADVGLKYPTNATDPHLLFLVASPPPPPPPTCHACFAFATLVHAFATLADAPCSFGGTCRRSRAVRPSHATSAGSRPVLRTSGNRKARLLRRLRTMCVAKDSNVGLRASGMTIVRVPLRQASRPLVLTHAPSNSTTASAPAESQPAPCKSARMDARRLQIYGMVSTTAATSSTEKMIFAWR